MRRSVSRNRSSGRSAILLLPLLQTIVARLRRGPCDEGIELHQLARSAGVASQLDLVAELPHLPPVFADFHPAGARALDNLTRFVNESLAK